MVVDANATAQRAIDKMSEARARIASLTATAVSSNRTTSSNPVIPSASDIKMLRSQADKSAVAEWDTAQADEMMSRAKVKLSQNPMVAMLAQANSAPQQVLELMRG